MAVAIVCHPIRACLAVFVFGWLLKPAAMSRRTVTFSQDERLEIPRDGGDETLDTLLHEKHIIQTGQMRGNMRPVSSTRRRVKGDYTGRGRISTERLITSDSSRIIHIHPSCPEEKVNFYRNFEEVVNITIRGKNIDNRGRECACTPQGQFVFCNCSHLHLQGVPTLHNGAAINGLDLSHNSITCLNQSILNNYPNLKYLSLSHNNISFLGDETFKGMKTLRVLDLQTNELHMTNGSYPPNAFSGLSRLVALRISNNTKNYQRTHDWFYPDKALSALTHLSLLAMDGLTNKTFGEGFKNMISLKTLVLSGYTHGHCKLGYLSRDTFESLGRLKMLNISDCNLRGNAIDIQALSPLRKLHTLDLSWNEHITMKTMMEILQGLHPSDLRELVLNRIEPRFSPGIRIHSSYLDHVPENLTCLIVSGNSIITIDDDVISRLPKSLGYLDISGNKLVFGNYLRNLSLMENLITLEANGFGFLYMIPRRYPSTLYPSGRGLEQIKTVRSLCPDTDGHLPSGAPEMLTICLPPKLRRLSMVHAGFDYILSDFAIGRNNALEVLQLSGNYFPAAFGSFNGFSHLKMLDMSNCQMGFISKTFFKYFPKLETLNLFGNYLGTDGPLEPMFSNLQSLTHLDLAYNSIEYLKNDTFSGLNDLNILDLSRNTLYEFNTSISHMHNLQNLNLNATSVHRLLRETRNDLDLLGENVKVHMHDAPLRCVCPNQEFLQWMTRSDAIPQYFDYTCILENTASLDMTWPEFLDHVDDIKTECYHPYGLFLVVLGATMLLLVLTVASIAYRFRWRLRYLYYGIHLWATGTRSDVPESGQFLYDVFLSYSSDDFQFVMDSVIPELQNRGLTTCIHSRDFLAGENVISNIIRSIKHSRRTLVVLTNNLLDSKWCRCEFQLCRLCEVEENKCVTDKLALDTRGYHSYGATMN